MRRVSFLIAGAALLILSAAFVDGPQANDKKKGIFQGGFGGGAFGGQQTPLNLLYRDDVKKELEVTDEQLAKVPAEVMVAISKVLTESQFKRFKQIQLQQKGNNAFKDADVQKALKLTADQKATVTGALEDYAKEAAELKGFTQEAQEKRAKLRTETRDKIVASFSASQKTAWREMIGEEFTFQQQGFGGFGGFGKGKNKKDAPKKDQ